MRTFPTFECSKCNHIGGLEDFNLSSKNHTHFEPYIGEVVDAFILTCKTCGYEEKLGW